jgi:predicted O-linked N-acetylglucosamine transferase (SPINDLY family)
MSESLREACARHRAGQFAEAAQRYREILAADPKSIPALFYLGLLKLQTGSFQDAERILGEAVALDPRFPGALAVHASALHQLGRYDDAIAALDRLLAIYPDDAIGWTNRGNILLETGRVAEARQNYDSAIRLNPDYAQAWHNRAVAKTRIADFDGALTDLDRALLLRPHDADTLEQRASVLVALKNYAGALDNYNRALALTPGHIAALKSRGLLLNQLQRYADALADFDGFLAIRQDDAAVWQGRGNALAQLNHDDAALGSFREALRLRPADAVALFNCASLLARGSRYEEARCELENLLALEPDFPLARGLLMHVRLQVCDWRDLPQARQDIASALAHGKRAIYPFGLLAFSDSPSEQLRCAEITARHIHAMSPVPPSRRQAGRHEKLRVAYLSGDFYRHAIPFLIAGVFEQHDTERFETFGISYGPNDGSDLRARLENAFTHFSDFHAMSDAEIADKLQEWEIDIAVDLKGYTAGARPGILAHRPAPIQVHYLGYPGTLGSDFIDYLIADSTIIPEEHRAFYSEEIVYLPDTYQCNDSRRRIATHTLTRAEAGLPEGPFVFCCFNGSQKIMPETFALWMEILADVTSSVLWLLEGHPSATVNLRREAQARGIAPERLIFAKHAPLEDHLARLTLADLVLDTLPYGAHTTASDALWAGVPVLTRLGTTFAGRVAASLLKAAGLPELITLSPAQYKSLACELAQDASRMRPIKAKLAVNRKTMPLFDTTRITRNLEAAYLQMWKRHRRGEAPASFSLDTE